MLPYSSVFNGINQHRFYAKHTGDCGAAYTFTQQALNFAYLLLGKYGIVGMFTTHNRSTQNAISMNKVVGVRSVFEVCQSIIMLLTVLMIDLVSIWACTNKSQHNQTVYQNIATYSGTVQAHYTIPGYVAAIKNTVRFMPAAVAGSLYAAFVTNGIKPLVTGDITPLLNVIKGKLYKWGIGSMIRHSEPPNRFTHAPAVATRAGFFVSTILPHNQAEINTYRILVNKVSALKENA